MYLTYTIKRWGVGLEQYYRDIETRLELGKFAKPHHRPKDWQFRTDELEELLRRTLIHTTCSFENGPAEPSVSYIHRKILERVKAGDILITYNYDTVIEESMPDSNCLWTPRDGYGIGVTGITHNWAKNWLLNHNVPGSEKSKIKLLKLHGSINWKLYQNSDVRLKKRPYVVRARKGWPVFDSAAFIPPGWHKRVDRNPFKTLWSQARNSLEACKTLVIVGYSLPDTDLIARALFLEVVRLRETKRSFIDKLHIADISDAVKDKTVNLFIPALGPRGVVSRYKSAEDLAQSWNSS